MRQQGVAGEVPLLNRYAGSTRVSGLCLKHGPLLAGLMLCRLERASDGGPRSRSLGTIDMERRPAARGWLLLVSDCERVLVTAGGAAGTSDGDARFASAVSTAGSESRSAGWHREYHKSTQPRMARFGSTMLPLCSRVAAEPIAGTLTGLQPFAPKCGPLAGVLLTRCANVHPRACGGNLWRGQDRLAATVR